MNVTLIYRILIIVISFELKGCLLFILIDLPKNKSSKFFSEAKHTTDIQYTLDGDFIHFDGQTHDLDQLTSGELGEQCILGLDLGFGEYNEAGGCCVENRKCICIEGEFWYENESICVDYALTDRATDASSNVVLLTAIIAMGRLIG